MQYRCIYILFFTFASVLKRIGNIFTFLVLAALLLLNGTSREFIHTFTGHQDTVDQRHLCDHTDHHAAFENKHHHCDFLQYVIPVYQSTQESFQLYFLKEKTHPAPLLEAVCLSKERKHTALRGPPSLSSPAIFLS